MAHIQKLWYHVNSLGTWRSLVARLFWEQDVAGSNPVVPTIFCGCGSMVEPEPSKLVTRVRFPSSAPKRFRFAVAKRKLVATNVCGTSSSHCKLASRPVGQRASFSHESDAPQTFSLTLFQPLSFLLPRSH